MTDKASAQYSMSHQSMPAILFAGEYVVKAGWTLGPRVLEEYELVYFPLGSRTQYEVNGVVYKLIKPCFIITRPGEEHSYTFDPDQPTRHLFLHFLYDLDTSSQYNGNRDLPLPFLLPDGMSCIAAKEASIVPQLLKHILFVASTAPLYWEPRCNLLLQTALSEIAGSATVIGSRTEGRAMPQQVLKALDYIDKHLGEPISIADIAESLGWSHEHFTRQFVQHAGITPRQAVLQRRIERACQLLVQEQWSVKQIAYAVGFKDEHYFSRAFVKMKGMSASEYREQFADPRALHLAPVDDYHNPYPLNRYFTF